MLCSRSNRVFLLICILSSLLLVATTGVSIAGKPDNNCRFCFFFWVIYRLKSLKKIWIVSRRRTGDNKCNKGKIFGRGKWRKLIFDFGSKENQKKRSYWALQALHWWLEHKQFPLFVCELSLFLWSTSSLFPHPKLGFDLIKVLNLFTIRTSGRVEFGSFNA